MSLFGVTTHPMAVVGKRGFGASPLLLLPTAPTPPGLDVEAASPELGRGGEEAGAERRGLEEEPPTWVAGGTAV